MGNGHVCITDEDLQQMKHDLKDPTKREEIEKKGLEIQNCVMCKRKWMKFWAEKK